MTFPDKLNLEEIYFIFSRNQLSSFCKKCSDDDFTGVQLMDFLFLFSTTKAVSDFDK